MPKASRATEEVAAPEVRGITEARPRPRPWPTFVAAALALLAVLILASWLALAVRHADDRFGLNHASGARMALAWYTNQGTLYPPLYDGESYGGTRFMPIPILLHAGLARLTGEYLVSGKVLTYLSFALLLAVAYVAMRRVGAPRPLALAVTAGLVATRPGLLAATSIHGDAFPVALQLAAVGVVAARTDRRALLGAAALCSVAFFAKLSAVWGPIAIGVWLAGRDRRAFLAFSWRFFTSLAFGFVAFGFLSGWRLFENVFGFSLAGARGLDDSFARVGSLPRLFAESGGWPSVLVAVGLFGVAVAVVRKGLTIYHLSFAAASLVLVVVMTDFGTHFNHLIDIVALSAILAAGLWEAVRASPAPAGPTGARHVVTTGLSIALLAALAASYSSLIAPAAGNAVVSGSREGRYERSPLEGRVAAGNRILSEDPYIQVELGIRPVVLDAFIFREAGVEHPAWAEALALRIERREFDRVVLLRDLATEAGWYRDWHFGPAVYAALARHYRLVGEFRGYFLYLPTDL